MEIKVKDVMSPRVVTCSKMDNALDVALKMVKEDVGSIVVVEGKKPIGIITREDIVTKVVAEQKIPIEVKAKEIMNTPLITCDQNEDLSQVVKRMIKYDYLQMPVKYIDKLVGFVTLKDILKAQPGMMDLLKELLEETPLEKPLEEETTSGECELCGNFSETLHYINGRWICEVCEDEAKEI